MRLDAIWQPDLPTHWVDPLSFSLVSVMGMIMFGPLITWSYVVCLRHAALTHLGEGGADAFTIMRSAGHSSVTVSQRYVHPTGETVQLAFDQLEALNVVRWKRQVVNNSYVFRYRKNSIPTSIS